MSVKVRQTQGHLLDACRSQPQRASGLERAVPVRGVLQLSSQRPCHYTGQRNAPMLAALIEPGASRHALPPLDKACVKRIVNDSLLISGIEEMARARQWIEYP